MEFNDPDEEGEELGLPVLSIHDTRMSNSGEGAMVSEAGELAKATSLVEVGGPDHWKSYGGCRGGGGSGVKYRECLKNHAVGIGGSAVDGCGEFMAAGEEGTIDALRCAACGCHRNFHRKEQVEGGGGEGATRRGAVRAVAGYYPHLLPYFKTPAGYLHHHFAASALAQHPRPAPLALPSTSQEDASQPLVTAGDAAGSGSRKRFRSKFTQEQKERMLAFAERLGWRIQKHDEEAVQQFCRDACIKRHVFKIWMHNNKHTLVMRRFGREEMALSALV